MRDEVPWRAGFEVEVVLSDLDDPRFEPDLEEPMDTASPVFCQAVAKRLTQLTGYRWTAPVSASRRTGYFVLKEYDLDPLDWPYGRVAGVELLTPPLPLPEAEGVRRKIISAIRKIDGPFNFRRSRVTDNCAWHVNIDPGFDPGRRLDVEKFVLGFDELPLLAENDRLFSKYAAPQRHAYGSALLAHLRVDPQGALLKGTGLTNLLTLRRGEGKRYAANFAKLEHGYVELRHFSAQTFFLGPSLQDLLAPITRAFEMYAVEEGPPEEALLRRFDALKDWLDSFRGDLSWSVGPMNVLAEGNIFIGRQKIADLVWNGSFEIRLRGRRRYEYVATIYDVAAADVLDALAVLALDLAELSNIGRPVGVSGSTRFQAHLDELAERFKDPNLSMPAPDARLREQLWWWPNTAPESSNCV